MIRRRVVIHGSVQGIGFRAYARRRAQQLGLGGWIANRADGTVEAVFEGEPEAVDSLVDWCRRGPRGARVEHVDVSDEPPEGVSGFAVR